MKSKVFLFLSTTLIVMSGLALATAGDQNQPVRPKGYFTSMPLRGNTVENVLRESQSGQTVPLWTYSTTTTVDDNVYTGQIMGGAPNTGTTTIPSYLIPVIVNMPDGSVFDPTIPDPTCAGGTPLTVTQNSPLFQNSGPYRWGIPSFNLGTTQYVDALQRGQFFKLLLAGPLNYYWHTLFGLNTTQAVVINVPADQGTSYLLSGCEKFAVVNHDWLDNYVTTTLIPSLANQGVGPTSVPILLMYNVVQAAQGHTLANCCYLGYHGMFGSPAQVYAVAEFDSSGYFGATTRDVSILSHEMAEVVNDPIGNIGGPGNPTPAWGHIGQESGCFSKYEVGDPLTGTLYPPITLNGYTYHLQEIAMYSWFYRPRQMISPYHAMGNLGLPNWYSTHGTFRTDAGAICQ